MVETRYSTTWGIIKPLSKIPSATPFTYNPYNYVLYVVTTPGFVEGKHKGDRQPTVVTCKENEATNPTRDSGGTVTDTPVA